MKRIAFNLTAAMLSCSVAASSASADGPGSLRAAGATGPPGDERLSDERLLTRIGYPARNYKIRSGPGKRFRSVGHLRFYTEDRAPENYLVLRSRLDIAGKPWLNIRVPRGTQRQQGLGPGKLLAHAHPHDRVRGRQHSRLSDWPGGGVVGIYEDGVVV